jgi:hypothetical protein
VQKQTLALALVAAVFPVGLLAVSLLLSTDRPLRGGLAFYAGAATSLLAVGIVVIVVLHGVGLHHHNAGLARGGFRVGLGTAFLGGAWIISRHSRRNARAGPRPEASWRHLLRTARPAPVFAAGVVLYSPSAAYMGALQQIATSRAPWPEWLQLLVVVAIVLLTVEVPLLAYAVRPDATRRGLERAGRWSDRHGRQALILVLVVVGGYLLISGLALIAS